MDVSLFEFVRLKGVPAKLLKELRQLQADDTSASNVGKTSSIVNGSHNGVLLW